MKILYAIQGTGNGHISRARDIIPELEKYAEVHILISGIQADVDPGFPVHYRLHGMGFIFGKKGNVDMLQTFRKCITKKFLREIAELPIQQYDFVINDFEPVSAWAARLKKVPVFSLSHQYAVLHADAPKPGKSDWMGKMVMAHYAPVQHGFGFHFKSYHSEIFTPVIRKQVRQLVPSDMGHITVYLPAYDNERILKVLGKIRLERFHVFSKHTTGIIEKGNVLIEPIENERFIRSMASAKAVICGAGFETPAEALFLGKKLLVIPMKNQYEQQCNAAALERMGIRSLKALKKKYVLLIQDWLRFARPIKMDYPDPIPSVVARLFEEASSYLPESKKRQVKSLQV